MFMFDYAFSGYQSHTYSLAATGMKIKPMTFGTRDQANKEMYKICSKNGLHIEEVWDDHHDKTYICNNGVRFYIQRAMA